MIGHGALWSIFVTYSSGLYIILPPSSILFKDDSRMLSTLEYQQILIYIWGHMESWGMGVFTLGFHTVPECAALSQCRGLIFYWCILPTSTEKSELYWKLHQNSTKSLSIMHLKSSYIQNSITCIFCFWIFLNADKK